MSKWMLWSGDGKMWNEKCGGLDDFNVFQSYEWGLYKEKSGWKPIRAYCVDKDGLLKCAIQALCKPSKILTVLWAPGGAIGDLSLFDENYRALIKELTNTRYLYIRIASQKEGSARDAITVRQLGWKEPTFKILSGFSMLQEIPENFENNLNECSSNWRHNFKRAQKKGIKVQRWVNPSAKELISLYKEMEDYKNIPVQFSEDQVELMLDVLRDYLSFFIAFDDSGKIMALRGAAVMNGKGWDLFAAANSEARKSYATYLLYGKLLSACSQSGAKLYDLGGIDLENIGVYNFKKGTGAAPIQYLGEWEWSNNALIRRVCNYLFRLKLGKKH